MTYPALYNYSSIIYPHFTHKLKLREVKQLAQGHTVTKWKSQANHLQAAFLITLFYCHELSNLYIYCSMGTRLKRCLQRRGIKWSLEGAGQACAHSYSKTQALERRNGRQVGTPSGEPPVSGQIVRSKLHLLHPPTSYPYVLPSAFPHSPVSPQTSLLTYLLFPALSLTCSYLST